MAYIRDTARFSILDDIPADVWQENDREGNSLGYLCIVDEEPADFDGSFLACTFTPSLQQCEHVPAFANYLRDYCTPADEATARKVLAFYLRNWANVENEDAAELLRDEADRIDSATA